MIQAQIGHDAVDPCIKRTLEAEADQVAVGLEKGFLVDVLRVLFRGGQSQRQAQYRMVILAHQFLEGCTIAALRLAYQDVIVYAPQSLADHGSPYGGCIRGTAYRAHHIFHNTHGWGSCPPTFNPKPKIVSAGICLNLCSTFQKTSDFRCLYWALG